MKHYIQIVALTAVFIFLSSTSPLGAHAHVVVQPKTAQIASYQTFVMGVPPEKSIPTTAVRLVIPDGVTSVRPNVKAGWRIDVKKTGTGDEARVTEIVWSGGSIPADQRDEFVFSAKTPAEETVLPWKAYQTYADGSIVAWDSNPQDQHSTNHNESGPYSVTEVVDDLSSQKVTSQSATPEQISNSSNQLLSMDLADWVGYGALLIAFVALGLSLRRR